MSRAVALFVGFVMGAALSAGAVFWMTSGRREAPVDLPSLPSASPGAPSAASSPSPTPTASGEPDGLDESDVLRIDGLGPVNVGMTIEEAEAALGSRLRIFKLFKDFPPSCRYAEALGGPDDVFFMLSHRRVVRIDISQNSAIESERGIGIGDLISDVQSAYGEELTREPHPYLGKAGSYLIYDPAEQSGLLMIFETNRRAVTSFRSGYKKEVRYIEGCS